MPNRVRLPKADSEMLLRELRVCGNGKANGPITEIAIRRLVSGASPLVQDSTVSGLDASGYLTERRSFLLLKSGVISSFCAQSLLARRIKSGGNIVKVLNENFAIDHFVYRAMVGGLEEGKAYSFALAQISARPSWFYPYVRMDERHMEDFLSMRLAKATNQDIIEPLLSRIRSNDLLFAIAEEAQKACQNPYLGTFLEHVVSTAVSLMHGERNKENARRQLGKIGLEGKSAAPPEMNI